MDYWSLYQGAIRLIQNQEPLTFNSAQPGNAPPLAWSLGFPGRKAGTNNVTQQVEGGALVTVEGAVFNVAKMDLDSASPVAPATGAAPEPKVADSFRDASGVLYVVTSVEPRLKRTIFDCTCVRSAL